MTGLDYQRDTLVEVAAVITDSQLRALDAGIDVVIAPPEGAVASMGEVVREMHTASGLLGELDSGIALTKAQEKVLDYIRSWVPDAGKAPLAGNSVGTDKAFLERDMPELVNHLHYRIIDVSSIKELARRWYPRAYFQSPEKHGGHRALADILESIDELRYYRAALWPSGEGPTSEELKGVARAITDSPSATLAAGTRAAAESNPTSAGD